MKHLTNTAQAVAISSTLKFMDKQIRTSANYGKSAPTPSIRPAHAGLLQRKCACGRSPGVAGQCEECSHRGPNVQRSTVHQAETSTVARIAHEGLRPTGQPPEAGTRPFMGPPPGHEFRQVAVHAAARDSGSASWQRASQDRSGSESVDKAQPSRFERPFASMNMMIGGVKPPDINEEEAFIGGPDGTGSENMSYRESNELLECIRIMGEENAASCREQAQDSANAGTHSAIVGTEATTVGPTYKPCGEFLWQSTFGTSGRSGFLIQEITNVYQAQTCAGAADNSIHPTPVYYESWQVDASGNVTPKPTGTNDWWMRPPRPNTKGNWSMTGKVHWATSLEPAAGFVFGKVPDAGATMSTFTRPTNIANPILTRRKGGTWDCCGGNNTHTAT